MIYDNIKELIGNTPLLKIPEHLHGLKNFNLYAKLEYYNPFGSVKDRIALGMLNNIEDGDKRTVVEASSGNTAKGLAALCNMQDRKFLTITNRIKVREVRHMLQLLGASIEELPGMSDCPDPNDPNDFTTIAQNLADNEPEKYIYTDQYFNQANPDSHRSTGAEIFDDLGNDIYGFAGFLGTCGTTLGAGGYLKEKIEDIKLIGVIAESGNHIPGGRNEEELREVGFYRNSLYDSIVSGNTHEAIDGMLELIRGAGLLCGPTTGLCYFALKKHLNNIDQTISSDKKQNVVFIACDRVEQYFSYIRKYAPHIFTEQKVRESVFSLNEKEVEENANPITYQTIAGKTENYHIVDIRSHFHYQLGHIDGSINILDSLFSDMLEDGSVFGDKKPIIVVCRVGEISKKYAYFIEKKWEKEAYFLSGGINQRKKHLSN